MHYDDDDGGASGSVVGKYLRQRKELALITARLGRAMAALDALDQLDNHNITKHMRAWWRQNKKSSIARQKKDALIKSAVEKLSTDELEALGVKAK